MTSSEQHDRIRQMLARYRDALHSSSSIPTGELGDRVLWLPPEFNAALRELDRCLTLMSKCGNQQAIDGHALRTIRWHVVAWHIDVHYRQVPVYQHKATKGGWSRQVAGYRLEPQRNRDAREARAELGVGWLADHYNWPAIHLSQINDACGQQLAA